MREGWTYKKLGEVADISAGQGAPQGENNYCSDGIPFIKAGNLESLINGMPEQTMQKVSDLVAKSHRLKLYKSGSVLFAKSGMSCMKGWVYTLKNDCYVVSHLAVITPHMQKTEGRYLNYYFQFNKPNTLVKDAAYPSISLKDIENISIPVPSLSEQQSIVAELDKINELISLKKAQLSDLDSLAQSIFYDMFGDPIENEKGWEVKKLGEVVDIIAKLVDPNQEPYCNQFHVGPANIIGGTGEIVDCLIAKDENLISGKYAFKSGAVLYSKIRPNLNKVAIPSFDGVCSADMYPLSIKTNAVNLYIMRLLMTKEFLKYAVNCSGRARMPKINREALFEFKFCLPPLSLQQEFAKRIELIEQQKAQISSTIKDLETLLASRMQYWFE